MTWMLSPRALFAGATALDACLDREACLRGILLHGLSIGLDADPAAIDALASDDDDEDIDFTGMGFGRGYGHGGEGELSPSDRDQGEPRLFTATVVANDGFEIVQAFHASLANDESEIAGRLYMRMGAAMADAVTRVSAFLLALLQAEDYDLDALAWAIQPGRGWPFRHLAPARDFRTTVPRRASERWTGRKLDVVLRNGSSPIFPLRGGGMARVRVIDDCLDVTATIGGHSFVSTGGHLRVTVPWAVPKSVIAACIDQPLSNVIDLALCSYRDWPILSAEQTSASPGGTFVANVGTRPYVLPWVDHLG